MAIARLPLKRKLFELLPAVKYAAYKYAQIDAKDITVYHTLRDQLDEMKLKDVLEGLDIVKVNKEYRHTELLNLLAELAEKIKKDLASKTIYNITYYPQ